MDRDRALPLVLALLAIVALALAAATLDSAVVPDGGSGIGGGDDTGVGGSQAGSGDVTPNPSVTPRAGPGQQPTEICLPWLRSWPAVATLGLLFVGLFAGVYRRTNSAIATLLVCIIVAGPVGLVWSGLAYCGSTDEDGNFTTGSTDTPGNGSGLPEGGSGGLGDGSAETLSSPTVLAVLFVVIALVVVLVVVLSAGNDRRGVAEAEEPEPDPPDDAPEAIGRVAGTAADRIDDADVDAENEVYRAWREMTASLEVDSPETTTPREFERAAVEAGMDREDVAALTELFESVRYGGLDPTDEQERRAVETLRRIESSYGGD